jgi:RepB DNA-primase from phage plasmid
MQNGCAQRQLKRQFELDDVLCLVTIRPADGHVQQFFVKLADITDEYFDVLTRENADQNIYVAQNAFQEFCIDMQTGRTKGNVKDVRAVYAEVDENGDAVFAAILADSRVPKPHLVLESSPHKFQFIWYVTDFMVAEAESLNRAIAAEFGCDPAATDAARVLRLAGYANVKYAERPTVRIVQEHNGARYHRSDFQIVSVTPAEKPAYAVPAKLFLGVNRNNGMLSYMSSLRAKGLSKAQYLAAAGEANRELCDVPLDDSELLAIADSCERYRSNDSKPGGKARIGNNGESASGVPPAASPQVLQFHLPPVTTGGDYDYVIDPAENQLDGWFPLGSPSLIGDASGQSPLCAQRRVRQSQNRNRVSPTTSQENVGIVGCSDSKPCRMVANIDAPIAGQNIMNCAWADKSRTLCTNPASLRTAQRSENSGNSPF